MPTNAKKFPDITKNEFVKEFIKKFGVKSSLYPTAVFMAGLPGAGKTEFTKALINIISEEAVRLDMDEIASLVKGYQPNQADKFRAPATKLLNAVLDKVLREKIEFVMDGTFGSKNAIENIKRAINHGYKVKIVYIIQDPKIAWKFTLAREKIEHRSIDIDGFITTYFKIAENLKKVRSLVKKYDKLTLDVIVKNKDNKIGSWEIDVNENIDNWLKINYNNKTLKDYIND